MSARFQIFGNLSNFNFVSKQIALLCVPGELEYQNAYSMFAFMERWKTLP